MKKKIYISLFMVLCGALLVFGVGLKTKATALPFYQVNLGDNYQSGVSTYLIISPYDTSADYYLIYEDVLGISLTLNRQDSTKAYINNNSIYELLYNQLYLIEYMPQSNTFYFYEIGLGWNIEDQAPLTDIDIEYLFLIDEPDQQLNEFWITSNGFQTRFDGAYSLEILSQVVRSRIRNSFAYYWARQYGNGSQAYWYNKGRNDGYEEGQAGENAISPIWNLFQGIFGTIGAIFSIELAPHVYIGYFFLVPLFFGVVGFILWIWRKN